MNSFQACMKRKLKGGRGGKAAFRAAAKACKKSRR
jgi:hypothetical protein